MDDEEHVEPLQEDGVNRDGQAADQLPPLFADRGSTAARTTCEGRPLPSDQLSGSREARVV